MVTTGAIRLAKLRPTCHHYQTNTQFFSKPDALPVAQQTVCTSVLIFGRRRRALSSWVSSKSSHLNSRLIVR